MIAIGTRIRGSNLRVQVWQQVDQAKRFARPRRRRVDVRAINENYKKIPIAAKTPGKSGQREMAKNDEKTPRDSAAFRNVRKICPASRGNFSDFANISEKL